MLAVDGGDKDAAAHVYSRIESVVGSDHLQYLADAGRNARRAMKDCQVASPSVAATEMSG